MLCFTVGPLARAKRCSQNIIAWCARYSPHMNTFYEPPGWNSPNFMTQEQRVFLFRLFCWLAGARAGVVYGFFWLLVVAQDLKSRMCRQLHFVRPTATYTTTTTRVCGDTVSKRKLRKIRLPIFDFYLMWRFNTTRYGEVDLRTHEKEMLSSKGVPKAST